MVSDSPPVIAVPSSDQVLVDKLSECFRKAFNESPAFFVRVPGRVNLIGEHIDYCGYSVLPMALQQRILVAAKAVIDIEDQSLHIVNLNKSYPDFVGSIDNLSVSVSSLVDWHSYVLCGIRGISEKICNVKKLCGMYMAVAGDVPPNSGLSSSSALVSAAALTTVHANQLSKNELAVLCAQCERYIGTEGGGMDQAIAFLANPGCAKHISFKPLHADDVVLPSGMVVVVAHSLAEINKAASGQFNCRVAECRLAGLILAHYSKMTNWRTVCVLADVQASLGLNYIEMVDLVNMALPQDSYTKEEVCTALALSMEDLDNDFLPANTRHISSFKLRQRATHVFQEAARVSDFRAACKSKAGLHLLGELMNASHESLRDLYECSHPQLDQLVSIARESGALGARLTGAGWGGCMVALTTEEHAAQFVMSLKEKFYADHPAVGDRDIDTVIFATEPAGGAVIYQ